jgi:hypothetical protein
MVVAPRTLDDLTNSNVVLMKRHRIQHKSGWAWRWL